MTAIYYLGRLAQLMGMWLLLVDIFTAGPMGPSAQLFGVGVAVFVAAVLPKALRNVPISMPMVFLGAGAAAFGLIRDLPDPSPLSYPDLTLHLTEVCVIVSLMGAGLALDRSIGWRNWATTWRMLGIAMPLCIVGLTLLGLWLLGLGLAAALLVAAALAPTDPVLASEVQVGEPADEEEGTDKEDEVRFALTSEAGLNDGLAFPFVYLAIAMSVVGTAPSAWFPEWFGVDVLWRIGMGVLLGSGTGKALAHACLLWIASMADGPCATRRPASARDSRDEPACAPMESANARHSPHG